MKYFDANNVPFIDGVSYKIKVPNSDIFGITSLTFSEKYMVNNSIMVIKYGIASSIMRYIYPKNLVIIQIEYSKPGEWLNVDQFKNRLLSNKISKVLSI